MLALSGFKEVYPEGAPYVDTFFHAPRNPQPTVLAVVQPQANQNPQSGMRPRLKMLAACLRKAHPLPNRRVEPFL